MEMFFTLLHLGGLGFLGWGAYLAFTQKHPPSDAAQTEDADEPLEIR